MVRFVTHAKRDHVLYAARNTQRKPDKVYINEDLPYEAKKKRADIRSVAKHAKSQGAHVKLQGDKVTINSATYTQDTLNRIPVRYSLSAARTVAVNSETIAFYSKYSYLSNFALVNFKFQDEEYSYAEQCYQVLCAKHAGHDDLVEKLMGEHDGIKLKRLGSGVTLPPNSDWSEKKEKLMFDIVLAKFVQNPDIMAKLKATETRNLVEATSDGFWGAAAGLTSIELNTNTWKGLNKLARILIRVRSSA